MKKAILIIALIAYSFATFAQAKKDSLKQVVKPTAVTAKKDTAAKPEFRINENEIIDIPLRLNTKAIYALTLSAEDWAQLKSSPKLTGQQITQLEDLAKAIRQAIINLQNQHIQKEYEAFMAGGEKPVKKK